MGNNRSDTETRPPQCEKKAEKCEFWPEVWKTFIDDAKLEWRTYLAARDAFPNHAQVKQELIWDIVNQLLKRYQWHNTHLEADMLPCYQQKLYTLVSFVQLLSIWYTDHCRSTTTPPCSVLKSRKCVHAWSLCFTNSSPPQISRATLPSDGYEIKLPH